MTEYHPRVPMIELTAADLEYQRAREALIPRAMEHARKWSAHAKQTFSHLHTEALSTVLNQVEGCAFMLEMQRLAFEEGLIAYNPMESRGVRTEQMVIERFQRKPPTTTISKALDD